MSDLAYLSIAEGSALIRDKKLSPVEWTQALIARVGQYDGRLNAFLRFMPEIALSDARRAEAEISAGYWRGPLHGVPYGLKDIIDYAGLPTTAHSAILKDNIATADAFVTQRLRAAGAVFMGKLSTHEFAIGGPCFDLPWPPARNPWNRDYFCGGSSSGSGVATAAGFVPFAIGTDTGGSIRNPCFANGIAGIKPTRGLLSRDGIIPLGLSFDTGGPMARSIYDVAVALGATTGMDPADPATATSVGKFHADYTRFLDKNALRGARLGLFTDYAGAQPGVKQVVADSLARLRAAGAEIIEIPLPKYILERQSLHELMRPGEFKSQVADYLATLKPGYPRTLAELIALSDKFVPKPGQFANPSRWESMKRDQAGLDLDDPVYLAVAAHAPALIAGHLDALLYKHRLDAFIYPTNQDVAQRIDRDYAEARPPTATSIANITGFPDVIVPAGLTPERLPVTLSFLGTSYSEPRLLALAYAFEQAAPAFVPPVTTPTLPGETFTY